MTCSTRSAHAGRVPHVTYLFWQSKPPRPDSEDARKNLTAFCDALSTNYPKVTRRALAEWEEVISQSVSLSGAIEILGW
jgi:hypothetical protein